MNRLRIEKACQCMEGSKMIRVSQSSFVIMFMMFFLALSYLVLHRAETLVIPANSNVSQQASQFIQPSAQTIEVNSLNGVSDVVKFSVQTIERQPSGFRLSKVEYSIMQNEEYLVRQVFYNQDGDYISLEQYVAPFKRLLNEQRFIKHLIINEQLVTLQHSRSEGIEAHWSSGGYTFMLSSSKLLRDDVWTSMIQNIQ